MPAAAQKTKSKIKNGENDSDCNIFQNKKEKTKKGKRKQTR